MGILLEEYPVKDSTQSIVEYAETVAKAQLRRLNMCEKCGCKCPCECGCKCCK